MEKIVEYKLIMNSITRLNEQVLQLMKEGWQPLGAAFYATAGNFLQTMVKYEKNAARVFKA